MHDVYTDRTQRLHPLDAAIHAAIPADLAPDVRARVAARARRILLRPAICAARTRPWRAADAGRRAERCRRLFAWPPRTSSRLRAGHVVREVGMKVLTPTQPWATLVAIGAKRD